MFLNYDQFCKVDKNRQKRIKAARIHSIKKFGDKTMDRIIDFEHTLIDQKVSLEELEYEMPSYRFSKG